jgi:hypothetical protein
MLTAGAFRKVREEYPLGTTYHRPAILVSQVAPLTIGYGFSEFTANRHEEATNTGVSKGFNEGLQLRFIAFMLLAISEHNQYTIPLAPLFKGSQRRIEHRRQVGSTNG